MSNIILISSFLFNNGRFLVKENDVVDFDTPLIEIKKIRNYSINISKILNVKKNKIFNYLKKFVGEKVNKGEIIAEKKSFFDNKKIKSEISGIITNINHETGEIIIDSVESENSTIIKSFFKGTIFKINKNKLELKVKKLKAFPVKKSNSDFGAEIIYFDNDLNFFNLKEEIIKNKIFCVKSLPNLTQIKLEALGAEGFVTLTKLETEPTINYAQIKNINDFENIIRLKFPYCLNLKINDTIYFYE